MWSLIAWLAVAHAADLIVDGTTVMIDGAVTYDHVEIINGGQLQVTPYDGSTGGALHLSAQSVYVDATSSITANGAGYRGGTSSQAGEGPGGGGTSTDGGGGGGHGGRGGNGLLDNVAICVQTSNHGVANNNSVPSEVVHMGSGGGAGNTNGDGGNGGGAIWILAREIVIEGQITADGEVGIGGGNDAGGGGAGGAILLAADHLQCLGVLRATGGNGGVPSNNSDGGGGGGGGVIEQYFSSSGTACSMVATGGVDRCGTAGLTGVTVAFGRADDTFDWDLDGYIADDCAPHDPAVHPGAVEVCDGIDNNCNTLIDDADPGVDPATFTTYYADGDGDGYGDPGAPIPACDAPAGAVANADDCDDTRADLHPLTVWYADSDVDGYGDALVTLVQCPQPGGYVLDGTDCDDTRSDVHPGAVEVCDGVDNSCNTLVDDADPEVDPSTFLSFFVDADGDGYGDPSATVEACALPVGASVVAGDCDDTDPDVHPDAQEVCNGIDDDCDGLVDDADPDLDEASKAAWYLDLDGDGYGTVGVLACAAPPLHVPLGGDCDDDDAEVNPGATEVCDGIDNDCDDLIDDEDPDVDPETFTDFYLDADGDGFGDPDDSVGACEPPDGYVADDTDCDDADPFTFPGAPELCDERDNDCDGEIDNDVVDVAWYIDADGDGFGDPTSWEVDCVPPGPGWVQNGGDCDDTDPTVSPMQLEVCDGRDTNCNGLIDDNPLDGTYWYADADGDGYGDPADAAYGCVAPPGYVDNADDCDDTDALAYPDAPERCNGKDDDCDDLIDEGLPQFTWYLDADGDGYGDPDETVVECGPPGGYVDNGEDCDDTDPDIHPGATPIPGSGVDEDCSGEDGPVDPGDTGRPPSGGRDVDPDPQGSAASKSGCSCAVGPAPGAGWPLLALLVGLAVRRRRDQGPGAQPGDRAASTPASA